MPAESIACPDIPEELLQFLDTTWPERCPSKDESNRSIWMYAGKRELIRWLKFTKKRQENRETLAL